ncbi:MAG: TIGR00300 family protein [Thermoproteota archaeon]|jgi:lysine-ketoglutarate reductase/saccharopine dehydrogenase-like protein (TIGR00300 family)
MTSTKTKFSREIEVDGHLIDSMILTRIFDKIMDLKGEFEVTDFKIGVKKSDPSHVKLTIIGKNKEHLRKMLEETYRIGAIAVEFQNVSYSKTARDMVMPDNFYSTTNNPTFVMLNGKWVKVSNQMMDKAIVIDLKNNKALCKMIRDIKKGDLIATGEEGIRVSPPERPREGLDVFQFMSSSASTEKPVQSLAKKISQDIYETKQKGGKIVAVVGPATVHTGATSALAELIKNGYIDVLLAGNALLVHDVEFALYGTSLGVDVKKGTSTFQGHRNHMMAVNEIFKSGSVAKMVKTGKLRSGIIYECVKNNVNFVLAGSIRDDGPAPGVITDVVKAQSQYKKSLIGVNVVLMLSTMLHSIAVGNMLPSTAKVIAVDINPSSVTKLLDRGTGQAVGVVSDVGTFLPFILNNLKQLEKS